MQTNESSMRKWGVFLITAILLSILLPLFIYSITPKRRVEKKYALKDLDTVRNLLVSAALLEDSTMVNLTAKKLDDLKISLPKKFHRMEFFLKVQPLLSRFYDQYTSLYYSVPDYMPVLPFKARFVDGKLVIVESIDNDLKPGDEITKFAGMGAKKLYEYLSRLVSSGSTSLLEKRMVERLWHLPFILRKEKFDLVLKGGKEYKASAVPFLSYTKLRRRIYGKEQDFVYEKVGRIGVLKIKTFNLYGQDIQDFEDLLENIGDSTITALVIDLRDCEGGDFRTARKMLRHFVKSETTFKRPYIYRKTKYSGGMAGEDEIVKDIKEYEIKPLASYFEFKIILLVDKTTSNEALDFAYVAKNIRKDLLIAGEVPEQKLDHTFISTGSFLPAVKFYAKVSCAKWMNKGTLHLDLVINESSTDAVMRYIGKDDYMLNTLIRMLK